MSGFDKRAYYDSICEEYADHVVSPYEIGVEMPLGHDVDAWLASPRATGLAVDFGCGGGLSLELIAGRAGASLALDFSAGMLAEAARHLAESTRAGVVDEPLSPAQLAAWLDAPGPHTTRFVQGDLHELSVLHGRVDLAIASNSLSDDTLARSEHMFDQVAACLRPGGSLLALFPSWDATLYAMQLCARWDPDHNELGTIDDEGVYELDGFRQKFWMPEEIEAACERNGLRVDALEKIFFPWSAMAESGWGDFEGEDEMWDWYLRAQRT